MSNAPSSPFPWGPHALPPGGVEQSIQVGPLAFRMREEAGEVHVAWSRDPSAAALGGGEEADWQRWATAGPVAAIRCMPSFPVRALVVVPETPFHVTPGASARIYIRVPTVVNLQLEDDRETPLLSVPTLVMSNTWFGTPVDGELCFWLPTRARRTLITGHIEPHLVVCPLQIENHSREPLEVEKVAVRVEHLGIFSDGAGLWADETRVTYLADEEGSDLDMAGVGPREATGATLFVSPQTPLTRGFRARTFARLRWLSGF